MKKELEDSLALEVKETLPPKKKSRVSRSIFNRIKDSQVSNTDNNNIINNINKSYKI